MKLLQRWISVFVVAVAALAGSFLFNLTLHREAVARDGAAAQAAAKWQITAVPGKDNNSFTVFMVNQETGEVYKHAANSEGFAKIAGPVK
jgi:hypothetical protein